MVGPRRLACWLKADEMILECRSWGCRWDVLPARCQLQQDTSITRISKQVKVWLLSPVQGVEGDSVLEGCLTLQVIIL